MKRLCKLMFCLFCAQLTGSDVAATESDFAKITKLHPDNIVRAYFSDRETARKILISEHNFLLESNLDKGYLVLDLPPSEQKKLSALNITLQQDKNWFKQWQIKRANLLQPETTSGVSSMLSSSASSQSFSCYPTVEETYQQAQQLAIDNPQIAEWVDIGNSYEKDANLGGYDIKVMKLTNKLNTDPKPVLFIQGAMHAREMTPGMLTLDFAKLLINGYGNDADITWLLDQQQVHIIFLLNPDGRKKAEQVLFWRKNTNQNYCSSTSQDRGADLNRNFSFFWNQGNIAPAPSSGNQCDETYRGPTASSEPEVQAVESYVRSLFVDSRGSALTDGAALNTSGIHIDIHSYGGLVLWPWGHTPSPTANDAEFQALARRVAAFNGYAATRSIGLYPTDGTSDNVSYGELGVAALTFELGSEFFETCTSYEASVKDTNLNALIYLAKVTSAPYQLPSGPSTIDLGLTVNSSTSTTLTATIDDNPFLSGTPGAEPRQNIAVAEYSIDIPFNPSQQSAPASPIAMTATDGSLDSITESMTADIDTSTLSPGRHTIYVHGQDDSGSWGPTSAIFVDIGNLPPIVKMSVSCVQLDCDFDATNSTDDSAITAYLWDFGDANNSTGVTTSHLYAAGAAQSIRLTVTDDQGVSQQLTREIKPGTPYQPPQVSFSANCNGQSCQFDGGTSSDADGSIVSYQWNFGDGSTASGVTSSHIYQRTGNIQVSLTAIDNDKQSAAESTSLVISGQMNSPSSNSSGGGGILSLLWLLMISCYGFFSHNLKISKKPSIK